jgi:hypothetical protein
MDKGPLAELVMDLFAAIHGLSGYQIPTIMPDVQLLAPQHIQEMICKGPCGVRAFFLPEKGIFLNQGVVDPHKDAFNRSILLHELVHFVQLVSGKFETVTDKCDRWYSKELEAYQIQNAYLKTQGEPRRFAMDSLPQMCADR